MPSLTTPTGTTDNRGLTICSRVVAVIALLYLLNAFVQSGYVNALEAMAGAFWIGGCFLMSRWLNPLGILVASFTSSLVWGFWLDSQPVSDFLNFHNHAARVADDGSLWSSLGSKSPPTVVYYAAFHVLLGSEYFTNYLAGAVAWTAGALLIYRAVLPFVTPGQARMVCACTATYPSFVVFSVVPSSEAVAFLLMGTGAVMASKAVRRSDGWQWTYAGLAGLAIGVLYLTRMNNAVLLVPCTLALLLCLPRPRDERSVRKGRESWALRCGPPGALVATFAAAIVLFGSLSMQETGEFRVAPSRFGELLLLFGTNTETNGGYNVDDAALAGYLSDDPATKAAAPAKALDMALDRVSSDPWRFTAFAATTKVQRLWARERSLNYWSLGGRERAENVNFYVRGSAILAADGAYRMVLLLFMVGLIGELRRPSACVALGGIALLYSLPHVFIEVQPRYHLPMVPFLIVGAVLTFHKLLPSVRKLGKRIYGAST